MTEDTPLATTTRRRRTRAPKTPSQPGSKSATLVNRLKPQETPEAAIAAIVVAGLATNAATVIAVSKHHFADVDLTECLEALKNAAERVNRGDLRDAEALLMAQAVTLNALFTQLVNRAQMNIGAHLDAADRYMRLALKAQSQCRGTLETLAAIKNPPTVFARQANIAHGPQQVNNSVTLPRAGNSESEPNKLLEAHGERLELGTSNTAGAGDPALAALGARHRTENDER